VLLDGKCFLLYLKGKRKKTKDNKERNYKYEKNQCQNEPCLHVPELVEEIRPPLLSHRNRSSRRERLNPLGLIPY